MNKGNAKAFKNACLHTNLKIKEIYLVNNSMTDGILKEICEGLLKIKYLNV